MKINNLRDKLFTTGLIIVCIIVFVIFDIPCVFNLIFGIPCPGCGMTRAYLSLLQLDFVNAFQMHSMFWSVPILLLYYLFDGHLFKIKWFDYSVLIFIGVGFMINWIIELL